MSKVPETAIDASDELRKALSAPLEGIEGLQRQRVLRLLRIYPEATIANGDLMFDDPVDSEGEHFRADWVEQNHIRRIGDQKDGFIIKESDPRVEQLTRVHGKPDEVVYVAYWVVPGDKRFELAEVGKTINGNLPHGFRLGATLGLKEYISPSTAWQFPLQEAHRKGDPQPPLNNDLDEARFIDSPEKREKALNLRLSALKRAQSRVHHGKIEGFIDGIFSEYGDIITREEIVRRLAEEDPM